MDDKKCDCNCNYDHKKWWKYKHHWGGESGGHIYSLGVVGALFYFLPHVTNFQEALLGIIKSIGWPALIVFKALELLKF